MHQDAQDVDNINQDAQDAQDAEDAEDVQDAQDVQDVQQNNMTNAMLSEYVKMVKEHKKAISDLLCDIMLNDGCENDKKFLIEKR
jgi:hypothetical protein